MILYIENFEGVKQGKIEIEGNKGLTIEGFQVNCLALFERGNVFSLSKTASVQLFGSKRKERFAFN